MRTFIVLLLLQVLVFPTIAATLKGKITDQKGEPLPFAIVYIKGTTMGTSANVSGEYSLTLSAGNHKVVAQYMGFQQATTTIHIGADDVLIKDFSLKEEALEMKEYVVKSTDDPAKYIMRKVIARRVFHLNQIQSFQTDIYAKAVVRNRKMPSAILGQKITGADMGLDSSGKGIISQFEEYATYYAKGGKEKTVIHSVRESGNPNGLGFSQFPEVINFYQNNIDISSQMAPRGMISPINDGAFHFYKYKLEGDFKEGEHTIYKISFTPKRLYEPLFTGVLYIVDEAWSIHSLNVYATAKANIQVVDTLRILQSYIPLQKDEWVIKQQGIFFSLPLMGFDLTGNVITVYDNQQLNTQLPDSLFSKKIVSEYDKGANKKDSLYWNQYRPIPLEEEELMDFLRKDSIRMATEDPRKLDSIRKRNNRFHITSLLTTGYNYRDSSNTFNLQTNAAFSGLVNFNTVEGWNVAPKIGMRYKVDSFRQLDAITGVRYGFTNGHLNGILRLSYTVANKEWLGRYWQWGIEGGKYVFQFSPYNPILPLYNTISTLFYRKNYLKIYERTGGQFFVDRNFGNGLKLGGQFGYYYRAPLQNTDFRSFAKGSVGHLTDNIPTELIGYHWSAHYAAIVHLSASYQPGYTYVKYPDYLRPLGSRLPTFTISYTKGIPGLWGSKTDFDKWRFSVRNDFPMRLAGNIGFHLATGGFLNNRYVSIPDLNHIKGNQLGVATSYLEGFQVAPYYHFSNDAPLYGEAHIEWQLRGFLTNKIPLFRKLSWYLVTGSNAYYVNPHCYHVEAFVGLDNLGYSIYRFFRVDYVRGWNSLGQATGAIRLGISTNSLISLSLGQANMDTEW